MHYEIAEGEDSQSWFNFFEHLIERGLNPQTVKLIVSDGISALPGVITQCLPNAQQQRCTTHKVRGMKRYLTYQQLSTLSEVTAAHFDEQQAKQQRRRDIELTFTFYQFETELHPRIRTSNLLERLFEEFRRQADEIGAFPNEMSCLTLFFLVVQRDHAKHNRPFF